VPTATSEALVGPVVRAVAGALGRRVVETSDELSRFMATEIDELDGDPRILELLGASVEGNVETIVHMLAHEIPAERVEPPSAAFEYARRLAQRGVPANALLRAYRIGHDRLLDFLFAELDRVCQDPRIALAVARRLVADTFRYVDWICGQVTEVYEEERERWLANRDTVRAGRVRALLDGDSTDLEAAETTLGYALRGPHLALVAWSTDGAAAGRFVGGLADGLGRRALSIAYDHGTTWAWLPVGRGTRASDVAALAAEPPPGVRLAVGEPGSGLDGFRESHRQAVRAQAVALAAGPDAAAVTLFADVAAVSLLATDLPAARSWVADTLGGLAVDGVAHARLRETLLIFLATGGSYTAAAEQLMLHRNSVRYRVGRAQRELGRPLSEARMDIELALHACRRLGRAVLTSR
jgi:DNA-binding PucR family transcriptional regulator